MGKETWRNYRDASRADIGGKHETPYRPYDNQIQLGAILRIADAVETRIVVALEKLAVPVITLVRDRDNFQRANLSMARKIKRLETKIRLNEKDRGVRGDIRKGR